MTVWAIADCVAVWSNAVGEDLFPWFRTLSSDVERTRTDLAVASNVEKAD
jgi:hypothetical protein